jgi:hypothetical protein
MVYVCGAEMNIVSSYLVHADIVEREQPNLNLIYANTMPVQPMQPRAQVFCCRCCHIGRYETRHLNDSNLKTAICSV